MAAMITGLVAFFLTVIHPLGGHLHLPCLAACRVQGMDTEQEIRIQTMKRGVRQGPCIYYELLGECLGSNRSCSECQDLEREVDVLVLEWGGSDRSLYRFRRTRELDLAEVLNRIDLGGMFHRAHWDGVEITFASEEEPFGKTIGFLHQPTAADIEPLSSVTSVEFTNVMVMGFFGQYAGNPSARVLSREGFNIWYLTTDIEGLSGIYTWRGQNLEKVLRDYLSMSDGEGFYYALLRPERIPSEIGLGPYQLVDSGLGLVGDITPEVVRIEPFDALLVMKESESWHRVILVGEVRNPGVYDLGSATLHFFGDLVDTTGYAFWLLRYHVSFQNGKVTLSDWEDGGFRIKGGQILLAPAILRRPNR